MAWHLATARLLCQFFPRHLLFRGRRGLPIHPWTWHSPAEPCTHVRGNWTSTPGWNFPFLERTGVGATPPASLLPFSCWDIPARTFFVDNAAMSSAVYGSRRRLLVQTLPRPHSRRISDRRVGPRGRGTGPKPESPFGGVGRCRLAQGDAEISWLLCDVLQSFWMHLAVFGCFWKFSQLFASFFYFRSLVALLVTIEPF